MGQCLDVLLSWLDLATCSAPVVMLQRTNCTKKPPEVAKDCLLPVVIEHQARDTEYLGILLSCCVAIR